MNTLRIALLVAVTTVSTLAIFGERAPRRGATAPRRLARKKSRDAQDESGEVPEKATTLQQAKACAE